MDKRSLIFIVCLSAAFFGIQSWFNISQEKDRIAAGKKIQEANIAREKAWKAEAVLRRASLDQIPIAPLFADPNGQQKLASAVACGEHFLTLSWEAVLPKTVFSSSGQTLHLQSSASVGQPVFYSAPKAAPIVLPSIPSDQTIDVQIVTLSATPLVALGEHRNGKCSIPYQFVGEQAIAFLRQNEIYLPVGIYDPENKKVKQLGEFEWLQNFVSQDHPIALSPGKGNEAFYVLETPYQQLVFSTRGGSLAEINLPLKLSQNSKSIVREIDIDREIVSQSPQNARFPLRPYSIPGDTQIQTTGSLGGYYPLLRRSVLNPDGTEKIGVPPEAYALNIAGEEADLSQLVYKVTRFEQNLIQFQASTNQRRITKTFTIPKEKNGPYCLQLDILVEGDAQGLWLTSGVPDVELVGGSYSPLLRYQTTRSGGHDVETIDLPKKGPVVSTASVNWISNCNGFLGLIIDSLTQNAGSYKAVQFDGNALPTRLSLIDPGYHLYPPENYPGYAAYLPLQSGSPMTFRIFAGPFDDALLKTLDELYDNPVKGYNPEYASAQSIQGWFSFISQPFAKFLFLLMQLFYAISRSWAAAIILLTIALRAMMYPLNAWSIRSSVKMQEIAPKVKALQDRYKKDPRKAQLEVMNLYRESKINPFTGCLPVFLQMPFLIGMFYLLKSSFPLRGAMFIPGWIDDLAAPDVLFSWGQPIWFIGNEFHLLPILMGITMFIQQMLTAKTPKDASQLSDSQRQQKAMGNMMSVLFTVMFYNFPSGLNIYFMFSTLLGILQQWWMTRKKNVNTPIVQQR